MDNLKTLILGFTNHKDKQIKGQGHPCVFTAHLTFTGIHSETPGLCSMDGGPPGEAKQYLGH
jgi:hypothetical protein